MITENQKQLELENFDLNDFFRVTLSPEKTDLLAYIDYDLMIKYEDKGFVFLWDSKNHWFRGMKDNIEITLFINKL